MLENFDLTSIFKIAAQVSSDNIYNNIAFNLENVTENDGILITVVGYFVVFTALLILLLVIKSISKFMTAMTRKQLRMQGHHSAEKKNLMIHAEVSAAIAMALHLHFNEMHDEESAVLTIENIDRKYSPWSAKIYNIRKNPKSWRV